jgi:hypothetical protein
LEDKVLSKTEKVKELKEKIEAIKSKMPKPNTASKEKSPEIKVVVKNKEEKKSSPSEIETNEDEATNIVE